MGLFVRCGLWVVIFSAFCPLWVAYRFEVCNISIFAGCGLLFGLYGWIYAPPPHPQNQNAKSGLPHLKFFLKFYFFIFAFVIEVFKPVGAFVFCWLFSYRRVKNRIFFDVVVGTG